MPKTTIPSNLCVLYQIGILMQKKQQQTRDQSSVILQRPKMVIRMCLIENVEK